MEKYFGRGKWNGLNFFTRPHWHVHLQLCWWFENALESVEETKGKNWVTSSCWTQIKADSFSGSHSGYQTAHIDRFMAQLNLNMSPGPFLDIFKTNLFIYLFIQQLSGCCRAQWISECVSETSLPQIHPLVGKKNPRGHFWTCTKGCFRLLCRSSDDSTIHHCVRQEHLAYGTEGS